MDGTMGHFSVALWPIKMANSATDKWPIVHTLELNLAGLVEEFSLLADLVC